MKFYKVNNEVMAIEQGQEFLVKADWVEMTVEEIELFKNPPKTQEQLAEEAKQKATAYLSSTDWYVVRFTETGVAIPEDISQARAEARLAL